MSVLIDKLIKDEAGLSGTKANINGGWFIAKPYSPTTAKNIQRRLKDAFRIIKGEGFAYHFKEDEK